LCLTNKISSTILRVKQLLPNVFWHSIMLAITKICRSVNYHLENTNLKSYTSSMYNCASPITMWSYFVWRGCAGIIVIMRRSITNDQAPPMVLLVVETSILNLHQPCTLEKAPSHTDHASSKKRSVTLTKCIDVVVCPAF